MATVRPKEAICILVEDGTLELETEADLDPNYTGLVTSADTLMVVEENARNLQLYSRRDGKLLATSERLESGPNGVCLISNTEVGVILYNSKIVILSFKSIDDVKLVKTLDLTTVFDECDAVAKVKSTDKLIASGKKQDMTCWCVVSITDEHVETIHTICKWGYSHLAIKNNTVYISCLSGDSTVNGVYAYDIFNPHTQKFLYQHEELYPRGLTVDTRGFIFVCYFNSNSIHQLTDRGELVTIHRVSSEPRKIFYEDQHGVLYTTSYSNEITRYRLEYLHQPGIPIEILNMDDRSIQLFEEALKDGKETVCSIRVMVVGHFGVGKTTLIKRLLGEEVNISERQSTEGIDVYVNCCDVSLSTNEWTQRIKDSEQDYRLQRLARVLNEQQSTRDKVTEEERVIIPPQGEITLKSHEGDHVAVEDKNIEVLYHRSPQRDFGQDFSSTTSQQEESHSALVQSKLIKSETNTIAILKLLQENADKLKQDTGETSPLTVWDFAGQYAFYTTHQTFLTRRAIYLLVSDVSKQLTDLVADECYFDSEGIMKCKVHELVEVWLNSIHSCAPSLEASTPPVILVGTHVDQIVQKQSPAKGIESETSEKVEFALPTTSTPAAAATSEQPRASTILGSVKKFFKSRKTKGIVEASPVSSMMGAHALPAEDHLKKQKKSRLWPGRKKRIKADVMAVPSTKKPVGEMILGVDAGKRYLADNLPNIAQEVVVHTDDYSTPAGVKGYNDQEILIALYDFTRNNPDELSFSKGDELILIEKSGPGWWQAKNSLGEVGLVPSNYMQVQSYRYKLCERYFREVRSYLRDKPTRFHLVDEDFAIDNTVYDSRLEALKEKIVQVASQQPYWREVIPARWLPLEQELMKLKVAGIKVIPWSLLEDLNKALAVQIATDELDVFLRFQHDIGTVLYFSMELLKKKIVLDPQWMINALKSLITAEMFVLRSTPAVIDKWFEFKEKGQLSLELVDALWTKEKYPDFHDNKTHLLLLMEQMNIIAKPMAWSEDSSETKEENYFLAPCMLHQKTPEDVIFHESHPQIKSSSVLCCVFTGKFLPSPIFHRLLAACITQWPIAKRNLENLIFCGCCVFQIDHTHRLILHFREYVIFAKVTKMSNRDENPDQNVCIQVRLFINTNLSKIIGCLGSTLQYEWYIQCPQCKGDDLEKMFPVSELQKWKELPCYFHDKGHMVSSSDVLKFWFKDQVKREPIMQDHINHFRLEIALRNICGEALREILIKHVPAGYADIYQAIKANQANLRLNKDQRKLVFPSPHDTGKVENFDISLLYTLIRNVSSIPAPATGWGKPTTDQPVRDTTLEANVERIRFYRNHISGHSVDGKCSQQEFEDYWKQIDFVLSDIENALGKQGYKEELEKYRNQALPY